MDLSTIPKSFWNAVSFSIVAFTIGFLFISFKSGELTVKFNQLEVRTTDAIAMDKTLQDQKENIERLKTTIDDRESKVDELERLLQEKIEELILVKSELASAQDNRSEDVQTAIRKIQEITEDENFTENVVSTRKELSGLQSQQKQQQEIYQQQQRVFDQQQQQQQQRSY